MCLLIAGTKKDLKELFTSRKVIQFAEFYPVGHKSTDYEKFFESEVPYPIKFKSGYEPYVLVSRKHMPWYDERFRGYGWDKVRNFILPMGLLPLFLFLMKAMKGMCSL